MKFEFIWSQKSKNKLKLEQVTVGRRKCALTVLPVAFARLKKAKYGGIRNKTDQYIL